MRMPRGDRGASGWTHSMGRNAKTALIVLALAVPARPAFPADSALPIGQVSFEDAIKDLGSGDAAARLKSVQLLKRAGYPEAALPLAPLVNDPDDSVQLEAIAAELNIFLAEPAVAKKRVALVVEVRNAVQAEPAFTAGTNALGARAVPGEVLSALRIAMRDQTPRVAIEALYAFGVLAIQPAGESRRALLRGAGPDVAAFIGSSEPSMRYAAVRVLGRVFAQRATDEPIEPTVGDAVITALNDNDRVVRLAAMQALGAMRYDRGAQALTDLFGYYVKGESAEAALDALAHIAHAASVPLFTAQLASKSASLRGIAIEGLTRTGDASQLPVIQAALEKEREVSVSLAGSFALVVLGKGPTDQVADGLGSPRVREQAKRYLIELAPGRTASFAHQLMDLDPQVRADMADVLGLAGDVKAIPVLEPLTKDPDPLVARSAERALARLRATVVKPAS